MTALQSAPRARQTRGGRRTGSPPARAQDLVRTIRDTGEQRERGAHRDTERVPSTFRFRKFPGTPEGVWSSILATLEFPESESWSVERFRFGEVSSGRTFRRSWRSRRSRAQKRRKYAENSLYRGPSTLNYTRGRRPRSSSSPPVDVHARLGNENEQLYHARLIIPSGRPCGRFLFPPAVASGDRETKKCENRRIAL